MYTTETSPWSRRVAAVLAAGTLALMAIANQALAVTLPSQDPFYAAPNPMPAASPGTVLASRSVTLALPVAVQAWQLKYATLDQHSQPVVAIATLIVPQLPAVGTGPRPLLAYNFAIDADDIDCNPSYALQGGFNSSASNANSFSELPLVQMALTAGWAVVVSDHEGLAMNWTVTAMSGHAVLDGIRAAKNFSQAGLGGSPVGMWGYSGGAEATMAAAELASSYAPELSFKGIAAGGVPVDLINIAHKADGTWLAGIELAAIVGQIAGYPEYGFQSYLNANGQQLQKAVRTQCISGYLQNYSMQKMDNYTTAPGLIDSPAARQLTSNSRLGQQRPAGPLYIYQGYWDELIPYADVTGLVNQYCSQAVPVTYNLDHLQYLNEHFSYSAIGAPGAFSFLLSAFAGMPLPSNCGAAF